MTSPRWLNPAEHRAWLGYRRMQLLLNAQLNRDLAADSALSESDYTVLSALSDTPDGRRRLSEMATRMLWSQSRLSHHITRMQGRGLVQREESADDARGTVVALTAAGRASLRAAAPHHVDSVRRHLIDLLSAAQIKALGDIAEIVLADLGEKIQ